MPQQYPTISPSSNPSNQPTPLQYCPPAYDPDKTNYIVGEQVELMNHIHICAGGRSIEEAQIYEPYCNIFHQSMLNQGNLQVELELWNEAWTFTSACYKTEVPTTSPMTDYPSISPTNNPTETGPWYPDLYVEEQRCVRGDDYPFWMSLSSNGRLADQPITPVQYRRILGFRRSAVPHLKGLGQEITDLLFDTADY